MTFSVFLYVLMVLLFGAVHHTWGLKCLHGGEQGDIDNHKPVFAVENKECADAGQICQVMAGADTGTGAKMIGYNCTVKPADMKCARPIDSAEGKTGNIGPAYCEKEGCNTVEFLKKSCGPGGGGGGGGSIHTQTSLYYALFMTFAVSLTSDRGIRFKIKT